MRFYVITKDYNGENVKITEKQHNKLKQLSDEGKEKVDISKKLKIDDDIVEAFLIGKDVKYTKKEYHKIQSSILRDKHDDSKLVDIFDDVKKHDFLNPAAKKELLDSVKVEYTLLVREHIRSEIQRIETEGDRSHANALKNDIWNDRLIDYRVKKSMHKELKDFIEKGVKVYICKIKYQKSYQRGATYVNNGKRRKQQPGRVKIEVTLDDVMTHNLIDIDDLFINKVNDFIADLGIGHIVSFDMGTGRIDDDYEISYVESKLGRVNTNGRCFVQTGNGKRFEYNKVLTADLTGQMVM